MARNPTLVRLVNRLRSAAPQIKRDMLAAVQDGADDIAGVMRRVVPKKSGALARSIRAERGRKEGKVLVKAGGAATTKPVRQGGPDYDYAMAVEFGTKPHRPGGIAGGALHPGSRPRPFFWPAYRLRRKPVRSAMLREARRSVKKHLDAE